MLYAILYSFTFALLSLSSGLFACREIAVRDISGAAVMVEDVETLERLCDLVVFLSSDTGRVDADCIQCISV